MRIRTLMAVLAVLGLVVGSASADLVINEILYDGPGGDEGMFTELYGTPGMVLDGYKLIGVNGNDAATYRTIPLDGFIIPADGFFVLAQDGTVANADGIDSGVDWQNGDPDQVAILDGADLVVDSITYGLGGSDLVVEGTAGPDVTSGYSIARCPDGADTDDNSVDCVEAVPTPGEANDCDVVGPAEMLLCDAMEMDTDGLPIHLGTLVHITETLTVLNDYGVFGGGRIDNAATDGNCCVYLFDFDTDLPLYEGDQVDVTGTVAHYNGKIEISGPDMEVIVESGGSTPAPELITTGELALNGSDYENCLIQLDGLTITAGDWPIEGENANLTVDDGSGPVTMRIDGDTDIDGTEAPANTFTAIGIGAQYDSSPPYDEGFQIIPRKIEDIIEDVPPPVGACCDDQGNCAETTEDVCIAAGGEFMPDEVCDPNPCTPPSATEEASWGSMKSMFK